MPKKKQEQDLGKIGFLLGLIGIFVFPLVFGILALIFAILAFNKGQKGTAALILGIIDLVWAMYAPYLLFL